MPVLITVNSVAASCDWSAPNLFAETRILEVTAAGGTAKFIPVESTIVNVGNSCNRIITR